MKKKMNLYLLLLSCFLLNSIECNNERKGRILNSSRREGEADSTTTIERQQIQRVSRNATIDTTIDDVIEEIIDSSRQGRNIEGLDEVYQDPIVMQALSGGDDVQARNLIRDKLCDLGLMECEKPRPTYYVNAPPGHPQYSRPRPPPQSQPPPPFKQINPNGQIYGAPRPVPLPGNYQNAAIPPRKIGYSSPQALNSFNPSRPITEKFGTEFYEHDSVPSSIKFGYTEKPTIVVNQNPAKRDTPTVSQNTHVHHHYVHVDGAAPVDGAKTVLVNTPISEYSAVNQLSSSSLSAGQKFPLNSYGQSSQEYEGFTGSQYGLSSNVKPIYDGYNNNQQYSSENSYTNLATQNKYSQKPQSFDGSNGLYNVGASYHASQPDFHKKELNINGNSQNNLYGQQQQQQSYLNSQQKYNKYSQFNQGELNSAQSLNGGVQDDCICVPFEQCPATEIVGRRDDLILPIDPRNLPVDIEAEHENSTISADESESSSNSTVHKISKRQVENNEGRLGYGGGGAYGPNVPPKKILPTLGVSFGLPVPNYGGYPISPFGPHIPNQHFGAISPNGLNLGLVNVNPLVSLQVTKSEHGGKLVKPFINLHVTPNKGIFDTLGGLFYAKKGAIHKHLHLHRYPPQHPIFIDGHHGPPDFPPPHYPPPHFLEPHYPPQHAPFPHLPPPIEGPILPYPPPNFHHHEESFYPGPPHGPPHGPIGFRSNNNDVVNNDNYNYQSVYQNQANANNLKGVANDDFRYARQYSNNEYFESNKNLVQSTPVQAPGASQGSEMVSFPSSRRRRDTDQVVPSTLTEKKDKHDEDDDENSETAGRAYSGVKRQAYNNFPKQCGPKAVCCRRPIRQSPPTSQYLQPTQQNQYLQSSQNQFQQPPPQFNGKPSQIKRCGIRNSQGINGRIKNPSYIDGDSEFGEYPWQVAILKKDPKESVYVCGGTLIDDSHILTAAHCVKTYSGFDLRIRLGEWDVNHDVEFFPYVERDVISVHVHPEYYAGTLDNDIAIIKINQPVDLSANPHINPACMPDKYSDYSRQRCWTTGWGKDNWEFGKYQNILKEVDVPIIDHNTCQNQLRQTRLGYSYNLNPGFLCAGGEEGKDACRGDGGGPLVCERNGSFQVVGIVSWGIGCGKANVPGVYVKVSHYLDWIQQITQRY